MVETKTTPLHAAHLALDARMVPFAGYEMPVQYDGIIAESKAVRNGAGMFDVSHMARLDMRGDEVLPYLEWATTNDVAKLVDGQGQYSMLPNRHGGVVDDIIVYREGPNFYKMVVNASNHAKDVSHLKGLNEFGVEIMDTTAESAMIAVQGPTAGGIVASLSDNPAKLNDLDFFQTAHCVVGGVAVFAARSGYTGEDGFELVCAASDAEALWNALLESGVAPCGLGSRDVLRVEAGLPLYGHELTDDLSPIAAGLGWVISKEKDFLGCAHIKKARKDGTPRKLQGIRLQSKRVSAPGSEVTVGNRVVGHVSSGVYSPLLECGIAFAFVNADIPLGTDCAVDFRGKPEGGTIVSKRFYKRA
ncbi:MAG: glycine cleavage system aminomethyltransferase GcvT [Fimbriimonadaceae bacterium]|nr:glycine cleavage system aminomethyltransferase GcvT [Fimbriimonadaceae bacterium]